MASRTSLRRFCQNVPLPQLVQGSYLTIRSSSIRQPLQQLQQQQHPVIENSETSSSSLLLMNIPIHVIIEPSWRDHGHVEFRQYFRTITDFVPPPPPPMMDTSPSNEINHTTTTTTMTTTSSSNSTTTTTTNHHRLHNKIQMSIQPNHPLQPSKDRNAMVPHVTIDLLVPPPPLSSLSSNVTPPNTQHGTTMTTATTTTVTGHTFLHQSMATLPNNSLHQELDEENAPIWMEEIVEHENDNDHDVHETVHGLSPTTNEINNHTNHHKNHLDLFSTMGSHGSDSYVVLTIQVPEKLNLTCELLHHNKDHIVAHNPMHQHNYHHPCRSSITVRNKIEGDVTLQNSNGDICVTKLRGHEIHLQNTNGIIYASNLLEAQRLTLQCTSTDIGSDNCSNSSSSRCRIRAKQIHASHVDITIDQRQQQQSLTSTDDAVIMDQDDDEGSLVDISSMFVSGSNGGAIITVHGPENDNDNNNNNNNNTDVENTIPKQQHPPQRRRAVRIKSHHGPIQVTTTNVMKPTETNPMTEQYYPIVELGGVNGSCEVSIDNTNIPRDGDNDEWSSCMVHIDSLAPDSVSLVTANIGNIDVTVDRKAEADLRLASLSNSECINEVGALLAEEDNHHHIVNILKNLHSTNDSITENCAPNNTERILIQTSAFTNRPENALSNDKVSYVDGWVENKSSEPDSRFERKNRGHEGVGKIRLDGAHTQALNSFTGGGSKDDINSDQNDKNTLRPLLAVVGTDEIRVETVSWLGAIARRYGLEESGRELGRTASRKGRTLSEPIQ